MGRIITSPGVLKNVQGQIDHALDLYQDIKDNNLKPMSITIDPVTNANGAYSHTTSDDRITEDMKAIAIEVGTPEVFFAPIQVTTSDGAVLLTCADAHGTSTVTVTFVHTMPIDGGEDVPASVTSTEFDILADRIGVLSNLETTDKSDIVHAINSTKSDLDDAKVNKTDIANNLTTTVEGKVLDARQGKALSDHLITLGQITGNTKSDFLKGVMAQFAAMNILNSPCMIYATWSGVGRCLFTVTNIASANVIFQYALDNDVGSGFYVISDASLTLNSISDKITNIGLDKQSAVALLGNRANGFKSLDIMLPKKYTGSHTITINHIYRTGASTDYKDDFSIESNLINGSFSLYTSSSNHATVGNLYTIEYSIT